MRTSVFNHKTPAEVSILARILSNGQGQLSAAMARHFLAIRFSEADKERMHKLAVANQEGTLSGAEKEELLAYAKAGTLLSILKAKARRALRVRPNQPINT
jgi:hypothetical protein